MNPSNDDALTNIDIERALSQLESGRSLQAGVGRYYLTYECRDGVWQEIEFDEGQTRAFPWSRERMIAWLREHPKKAREALAAWGD
jgi:hypothetical protein